MLCERCGAGPAGYELFDFCALCGTKLCDECMAAGCCGQTPAVSGQEQEREAASRDRSGGEAKRARAVKKKRAGRSGGRKAAASRPRS